MDAPLSPSGSAFNGNTLQSKYPLSSLYKYENNSVVNREKTLYVSLTDWCNGNFISKDMGRKLIAKRLLIGQKLYGQWWVCANLECLEELLDYLGVEQLLFDAANQ